MPKKYSGDDAPRRQSASKSRITLRKVSDEPAYELVYPRCVAERAEDMEEVYEMIRMGETEAAEDELLWLLTDCPELLEAHQLLGELALAQGNLARAQAHFGRAFELGLAALPPGKLPGRLPAKLPGNTPFFHAGKGLAVTLKQLGHRKLAQEVVHRLLDLDPQDPLRLREILRSEETG
ncbi:MAG: hypothetical protein NZ899_12840 [Thermoguttaceae bacterium]|nr:hypothetical protein [Thermoguttaceae bacterium]MDW8080229.1 hypothetical protein [Thermoguttaceae bacterium]